MSLPLEPAAEQLLRELAPQVLGILMRRHRDFASCEDAVQEALLAAAGQWPREGLPESPRAWLVQVASRRLIDTIRAEEARRRREAETIGLGTLVAAATYDLHLRAAGHDDTLVLLFMCCHPALTTGSAIALTLRAVGGLTTGEIARAFLVPESTMAQRISRAKQTIRASGVPFSLPTERERAERLRTVLHVLYLIFNEGYTTSAGPHLRRDDLSTEAIRLTRAVHQLAPEEAEVAGLLALMLLTDARRSARTGPNGELVPLMEQDRTRWDRAAIAEGTALLAATLPRGALGSYQVQAAIAALHDEASRPEDTDWPQILALYSVLEPLEPGPLVTLNRAIAEAMVHGPAAGLATLATLDADGRLAASHRLDAVRAHLLERAGEVPGAIEHYVRAAGRAANTAERDYLRRQAARLRDIGGSP